MSEYSIRVRLFLWTVMATWVVALAGCSGSPDEAKTEPGKLATIAASKSQSPKSQSAAPSTPSASQTDPAERPDALPLDPPEERNFAEFAAEADEKEFKASPMDLPDVLPGLPAIDEDRVAASGIRKIPGERLTLYTDLPSAAAIDELPQVFAAAIPQWTEYFAIEADRTSKWQMVGYIIQDEDRFRNAGLLPRDLPQFLHGYQRGSELWLFEQPSDYYRRHLLLHEGTHGFMKQFLGGAGPPWYMEGTAELLATHQWKGQQLKLRWFPRDKKLVEFWGRIKVIKDDYKANQGKSIEEVLNYDARAHLRVEPYAWSWAVAAFFDTHPAYRDKFREFKQFAPDSSLTFSRRFHDGMKSEWPHITREWHAFVANIDYGYDIASEAIDRRKAVVLANEGASVEIVADRGWQSSGFVLEAGATYRITATGRYQIAKEPKVWWCEPNGVTIRYHKSRPLGMLLGAIVDEVAAPRGTSALAKPQPIGSGVKVSVETDGTLYLRINDSPAELSDNSGSLNARIDKLN